MIPVRDSNTKRGLAPITYTLILLNFAVFVYEISASQLFFLTYNVRPLDILNYLTQAKGSFLTIHTSILVSGFAHAGYVHLFSNMLFLYVFGPALEKDLGFLRFLIFYLLAIFVAFYTHVAVYPTSMIPVIGASGAIAAILGAYLIFHPKARITTIIPLLIFIQIIEVPAVVFMLGWAMLQGFNGILSLTGQTSVAWWSHIGGFILGISVGIHFRWFR